ncbi:putative anti-sigma factor antagonist BtrV [Methanobrevibacter cuticularis]|uniref:Putative anti-sigma factor antagonist BtrV n=1 Tax=Methanobrevibacter cuticularis TaxID=47311 RepID=A0A166CL37_9EURY|nr:STAS domain-containing protein [Methanobrevibacter cuticularis]KZX14623.1 putative anti-sigma factor antagonist BtrV [Methanobrevibacter cuticularis]
MNIEKKIEGNKLLVKINGRLDTNTSPEFEKELKNDLPGIKELIFDFNDLMYISSSGLRVILSTEKIMNKQGNMIIKNVNDLVMEVFEVTGFIDILTIE